MPLPAPTIARKPKHVRRITFEVFEREDGLWDMEGHLIDTKSADVTMLHGVRRAGEPIHEMWIRVTINTHFDVVDACGLIDWSPYPGTCDKVGPDYARLIGLNLMRGFRAAVRERLPNNERCTHVHELVNHLPTMGVQSMYRELMRPDATRKPVPIDNCHAQRSDSEIVRIQYPMWYRGPQSTPVPQQHSSEEINENP